MVLAATDLHVPGGRGATPRLDGVSLTLAPGEVVVVMGPNGAGKSTLLACLSGALRPTRGHVEFDGRPLSRHAPRALARRLAVLPQSSSLSFGLSALDVALLGRTPHLHGAESRHDLDVVRRALHEAGVAHLEARDYTTLSGGERQRVHLARVLAQVWDRSADGPRCLLLDEPVAALDPRHQHEVLALCRHLADEGMGVLLSLHDVQLAARYADRLVLLRDGRVLADVRPDAADGDALSRAFDIDVLVLRDPRVEHPVLVTRPRLPDHDMSRSVRPADAFPDTPRRRARDRDLETLLP